MKDRKEDRNEDRNKDRKEVKYRYRALASGVCLLILFLGWGHTRVSAGEETVYRVMLTRGVLFLVSAGLAFLVVLGSYLCKEEGTIRQGFLRRGREVREKICLQERMHVLFPVFEDVRFRRYGKAMGLLMILTVIILWIENEPTIYLDSYVQVKYEGYHKYGKSSVTVDWEGIEKAYRAQTSWLIEKLPIYVESKGKQLRKVEVLDFLESEVVVKVDKAMDLKNGERIQLGLNVDPEVLSQILKCKLKFRNPKRVVEGLEVVDTFNPFQQVELSFTGINGKGVATILNKGEILETKGMYEFRMENGTDLCNGDTVKVSLWMSDVDAVVKRYRMLPIITQAEYIVTGLDSYLTDSTELDDAMRQQLLQHAEHDVRQYVKSISQVVDVDLQYLGDYVLTPDTTLLEENTYGMVYEITFQMYGDGAQYPTQIVQYYDVQFPNIVKLHNGGYDLEVGERQLPTEEFVKLVEQQRGFWDFFKPKYKEQTFQGFESLLALQTKRTKQEEAPYQMEWNVLESE